MAHDGAAPREVQSHGVKSGKQPKGILKGGMRGDVVALLNVCVQELDQLTALLEGLALTAARDRKDQTEMLTRILGKQAAGPSTSVITSPLGKDLRALSEAMHTHDQRVASNRDEATIAMIELRARIRHHFHHTFEFLAVLDPNPGADSSDEDMPQRWCCLKS